MTHQSLLLPASVDDTSLGLEPCSGRHRSSRTALQHPSSETIWRPVKPCFSLFMLSQVTCPVSRLARDACGLPGAQRLHVRRAGDLLVVTEADDLHCPGKSLFAARLVDFATLSLFRMTVVAPVPIEPSRLRAASGIITLAWQGGRWCMKAVGTAGGLNHDEKCIFDATEICG